MKTRLTSASLIALISLILGACISPLPAESIPASATEPFPAILEVITPDGSQELSLDELKAALSTGMLTIHDPVYDQTKTYEGFWLTELLEYTGALDAVGDTIMFRAADGYEVRLDVEELAQEQPQGLIAFRDVDAADGWEPFVRGKTEITPAPFYLVWGSPEGTAGEEIAADVKRPWPYQLIYIELIDFATTYDRIFPTDVDTTSNVYDGFILFEEKCLACHSMNLQGGIEGPELNVPQNITEYRDQETLVAFIKNSQSFRARSKMPLFEDTLTDEEIDKILAYVAYMADHKLEDIP